MQELTNVLMSGTHIIMIVLMSRLSLMPRMSVSDCHDMLGPAMKK